MLNRSQYPQYQTMNSYGAPDPLAFLNTANSPTNFGNFQTAYPSDASGSSAFVANAYSDPSRSLDLAPVTIPGASDAGGGILDSLKGFGNTLKDIGFTGSVDDKGNKTGGWGQDLFSGINAYMNFKNYGLNKDLVNSQIELGKANLNNQVKTTRAQQDAHYRWVDRNNAINGRTGELTAEEKMAKYGVTA